MSSKRAHALHFTVGSLPTSGKGPAGGFFDFGRELELLKAALLYADRVKLVSVGASFMAALDDLGSLNKERRIALLRKHLPQMEPGATPEQLENTYKLMEAVGGASRAARAARRRFGPQDLFAGRRVLDEGWQKMRNFVEEQFRAVGGDGFREALRSGLVELHPFTHISGEGFMDMSMASELGNPVDMHEDETYEEYADRVFAAVQDARTYPLFDDVTGGMVAEAARKGLILPSKGAVARGRHGGLSGDLLRRLPLFERATVPEVLDIRRDLSEHLDAFREAVAGFAETIGPASWDQDFAEEAERVFRERVAPTVRQIEHAVDENRSLKGLSLRFGPLAAAGTASSLNAFVGSGSVLGSLALLAAGVYQGVAAHGLKRKETEGNRLYFYYRAGRRFKRLGWKR